MSPETKPLKQMRQMIEGEDYYFNEDGLWVLTAKYHLERGYCCGNGCKHCPFEYGSVPEPRRSALIEKQRSDGNTKKDS